MQNHHVVSLILLFITSETRPVTEIETQREVSIKQSDLNQYKVLIRFTVEGGLVDPLDAVAVDNCSGLCQFVEPANHHVRRLRRIFPFDVTVREGFLAKSLELFPPKYPSMA